MKITSVFKCSARFIILVTLLYLMPTQCRAEFAERYGGSVQNNDGDEASSVFSTQKGTADLQMRVLKTINSAVSNGSLEAEKASVFKSQIDRLNDLESGYRSLGSFIPISIVQSNSHKLREIAAKLHNTPHKALVANSLHSDVNAQISSALAQNRISSTEAEKFFLRVTEIESNLESARADKDGGEVQVVEMNTLLNRLRSDISRH